MPKKCEGCRYFSNEAALGERCHQGEVRSRVDPDFVFLNAYTELGPAREICNKEGDGIFVYFQPKAETRAVASVPAQPRRTVA